MLLFEDDFEGNTLDDSKLEHCPEWECGGGMDLWDEESECVLSGAVRMYDHFSDGFGYY